MDNFRNIMGLILGYNKNFKTILESDDGNFNISILKIGDLILRKMLGTKTNIYHAGIFCGQNDVIHFSAILNKPPSSSILVSQSQTLSQQTGEVDKVGVKKFISGQKFFVLRLTTGLPPDLQEKINIAMDDNKNYNLIYNNCLHFALRLLGGTPGPMSISQPTDEDERSKSGVPALTTQN